MKNLKLLLALTLLFSPLLNYSQQKAGGPKVKVTGKIVEKGSNTPLEYSTISLVNTVTNKVTAGGITDAKGNFSFDTTPGIFNIKVEFISFKSIEIKSKSITTDTNLGNITLQPDATQLNDVVIKSEKSSVEIKLDKKVYNVGQDMTVKGGTASDVLDNVPSVSVDGDGNVSLRGNDNVKIFIDGRPSNAINIADALKSISADALDKVEVITNPSARYDAEGGAGIINIVLKKGKNKGINGTLVANAGDPKNYGANATFNVKGKNYNFFTSLGYQDIKSKGKTITNTNYLTNPKTINESITRENGRRGFNYGFGMDLYIDPSTTWTNSFTYRKSDGFSPNNDDLYNYQSNYNFIQNRFTDQTTKTQDIEYNSIFNKKFKRDGHELNVVFTTTKNGDNDFATITNSYTGVVGNTTLEQTQNLQNQFKNLLQADYVLPFGKGNKNRIEAGYKGDFNKLLVDYGVGSLDNSNNYSPYSKFTNVFDYKEHINALYSQLGLNFGKFNFLGGIRYEDSNIDISLITSGDYTTKKYHNFFPSAFLNYAVTDNTTLSINYSKRISRPRYRFLTPFSNYSSNINLFVGNTDINPSLTDAVELGMMNKIGKATITSSVYYNKTNAPFQFIRRPNGDYASTNVYVPPSTIPEVISTPVMISTPVNLDSDTRYGLEFNVNYNPTKWMRLNGNFNIFTSRVIGNYTYSIPNPTNSSIMDQFSNNVDIAANSWFAKVSSKFNLPKKIDFQVNGTYNAPQNTAQGKTKGVASANIALSKDVLKDKATIALNINDVFNSRKRISETYLPTLNSYNEMQMRVRQITLSFTYRFNKQKSDREKQPKKEGEGDNIDFGG